MPAEKINSNHDGFRWVVCQLEVLRNCLNLPAMRQKLKELPETLDETYNRILLAIPENCHHEAHAALQWLTYSRRPVNMAEVVEAIAVDRNNQIFDGKQNVPYLQRSRYLLWPGDPIRKKDHACERRD